VVSPLAVPVALGLDVLLGEPPRRLHPVAWFGAAVAPLHREWALPRAMGTLIAVSLPLLASGLVAVAVGGLARLAFPAGVLGAGLALFFTSSWRRLIARARSVIAASRSDPRAAREELPALVGRDPEPLSPAHLRSAAVESAAENLNDGLVAPLTAFTVAGYFGAAMGPALALALAGGAAAWVKAVNTLDSMLGYPDRAHGTAAARLDDVVMWVPARLTALLLAVVGGRPGALFAARPWTARVRSPNSGWPMGTMAAVAGRRLENHGSYVLNETA
jgi:adenosylcobinamide-phosphate synthase